MITVSEGLLPRTLPLPDVLNKRQLWGALIYRRLDAALESAREIAFDDHSRFVFFSDIHRGDSTCTDAFKRNESLFLGALQQYATQGFTYIEVGDGDELWKNRRFVDVHAAHPRTFELLHTLHAREQLHIVFGNHDIEGHRHHRIQKDGIPTDEGLLLRHAVTGQRLFVTHGHQADIMSDRLYVAGRLIVRHIWRRMQRCYFDYRLAQNLVRRSEQWKVTAALSRRGREQLLRTIEQRLIGWSDLRGQAIICGHTHRAISPGYGEPPYFNTGCCTVPGILTGLELVDNAITLVKWIYDPTTQAIQRHRIAPPRRLTAFV